MCNCEIDQSKECMLRLSTFIIHHICIYRTDIPFHNWNWKPLLGLIPIAGKDSRSLA